MRKAPCTPTGREIPSLTRDDLAHKLNRARAEIDAALDGSPDPDLDIAGTKRDLRAVEVGVFAERAARERRQGERLEAEYRDWQRRANAELGIDEAPDGVMPRGL